MSSGATTAQQLTTADRRQYVLDMIKSGAKYRDVAAAAIKEFGEDALPKGYDERYVWKDVQRELDKLQKDNALTAEEIRQLELERLDRMLFAIWPMVQKGHLGAIDRALRISERRCKLLGVDAPSAFDLTTGGKPLFDLAEWLERRKKRLQEVGDLGNPDEQPNEQPALEQSQ